jgi:hypothetical protein
MGAPSKQTGAADARAADAPALAALGLEAEFALVVDGQPRTVEELFRDPRDFVAGPLVHRRGTSYHLPTGGIVYFDTGVIEVATPLIEIERGCGTRATRSLWESILIVREGLAGWERRTGRTAALTGFSAHYNVSFDGGGDLRSGRSLDDLARLLAYILPAPVMLLATNRASTGVGVRPRSNRIEVTVDFTPSAPLMVAAATLITGIVRAVMAWPAFTLDALAERRLPVIDGFRPMPHTTRQGWLARFDCYPGNPFTTAVNRPIWALRSRPDHDAGAETLSLRQIAYRVFHHFRWAIARVSDPLTLRHIGAVVTGRAPSLLDLPGRPAEYEDVGRLCTWDNAFGLAVARSRYERVLVRALSGAPLRLGGDVLTPLGTRGWSQVVFRRQHDGRRQTMSLDALLPHLEAWERET